MDIILHVVLSICIIVQIDGQIPKTNFLFGTTRQNVVWIQHGTNDWAESNQSPSTSKLTFTHDFLGVYGTAYYRDRNYLVFSDTGAKSIFITDINSTTSAFVYVGTSASVGHLAVDWLSGNIYWCDGSFGWIGMLPLPSSIEQSAVNQKFKVVVDKYLDVPAGIAVHASYQWIFWTDIGKQPKIERSGLDGSHRNVLVLHGIIKPVSITVDSVQSKIYWTDPVRGTIESCDFYGNNRMVLRTDRNTKYFGIEAWQSNIYVSEQTKNEVLVFSNTDGRKVANPYSPDGMNVSSIALYTSDNQFVNNDACATEGCQHICIIGSTNQATCTCQDGYELHSDGKQCTAETKVLERSIVYTNSSRICALPITYINIFKHYKIYPDCEVGGVVSGTITHLAINIDKDQIYFNVGRTIYRQTLYQEASVLYTASNEVTGLTFDWTTQILYWTVIQSDSISHSTLPADQREQITNVNTLTLTSVTKPSYITINPLENLMFIVSGESSKRIDVVFPNNSTVVSIVNNGLTSPKWLKYDRPRDRLYWTDGKEIGSCTSDGRKLKIQEVAGISTLHGVSVYKDYVLWLQSDATGIKMYVNEINSDEAEYSFPMEDLSIPGMFLFHDKNIQPQRNTPCVKDNGGCQQICVVYGYFPKCECHFGYKLQADTKSCIADIFDSDHFLTIDELHNRIFTVINLTDIASINTGNIKPVDVAFDYNSDTVVWIDSGGNSIKSANKDGTAEVTLTTESSLLTSIDVDLSTGNLYYTTKTDIKVFSPRDSTKRSLVTNVLEPNHLKLHITGGKMFWSENDNGQPKIKQAFMDGSNKGTVVQYSSNRIRSPSDLVVDTTDNRLIWSDDELDKIESINLGNIGEKVDLRSGTGDYPVAVDVDEQYVYFLGEDQRSVTRIIKQHGGSAQTVFSSIYFGRLISLYKVDSSRISEHSICKTNNGQCSRLCLPRGPDQRTCNCQEGVNINNDGKTCIGDLQCPSTHGKAKTDEQCSRYAGVTCSYECELGYVKNASATYILCLPDGSWNIESTSLCSRILCPDNIENGKISTGCSRYVGSTCGFNCDDGFVKQTTNLFCQENGQWNEDTSTVCEEETEKTNDGMSIGAIVGLAFGGIVLLVIVIAVVVVCMLQKMRKESKKQKEDTVLYRSQPEGYGYLNPAEEPEKAKEEVYEEIRDEHLYNEKMNTAKALSESTSSNRYSKWPQEDPPPDYLEVIGAAGGNSPYLNQRSNGNYYSQSPEDLQSANHGAMGVNDEHKMDEAGYMTPRSSIRDSSISFNQHM